MERYYSKWINDWFKWAQVSLTDSDHIVFTREQLHKYTQEVIEQCCDVADKDGSTMIAGEIRDNFRKNKLFHRK